MGESSVIEKLPQIVKDGRKEAKKILDRPFKEIVIEKEEIIPKSNMELSTYKNEYINQFYQGDNLIVIKRLLKEGYKGKIDLIYIDPPFLTKANYKGKIVVKNGEREEVIEHFAYKDIWEDGLVSYLEMIYIRLYLMRELLSEKGTIYVHLDYRTVHYVKVLMDEIFHEENFINEVIWAYKSGGVSKRYYSRKHDNILVYGKTKDYIFNSQLEKSYNRGFKPYRFKGVEEFKDQLGWYTLVNLKDVWQVDVVGRTSKERVGYDTQKPEKLLERIVLTSSNEDSIVADFFAGSGTTGIVAERFNRRWIMSDKGALSLITINKRLTGNSSKPYYLYKIDDKFKGESRLLIKSMEINKDKRGKEGLHIELDKYCLHIDKIDIKDKYKEKIKEVLSKDSIALIDFIGIDINYDGKIPLITYQYYRKDDDLTIDSNITIKDNRLRDAKSIFIKCIDVFGFQCSVVYEINNERVVICQGN